MHPNKTRPCAVRLTPIQIAQLLETLSTYGQAPNTLASTIKIALSIFISQSGSGVNKQVAPQFIERANNLFGRKKQGFGNWSIGGITEPTETFTKLEQLLHSQDITKILNHFQEEDRSKVQNLWSYVLAGDIELGELLNSSDPDNEAAKLLQQIFKNLNLLDHELILEEMK